MSESVLTVGGLTAGALLLLGGHVVCRRAASQVFVAVVLAAVLIGCFTLWVLLAGPARAQPWVAIALFAGATGLFRLMGRFEAPRRFVGPTSPRPDSGPLPRAGTEEKR